MRTHVHRDILEQSPSTERNKGEMEGDEDNLQAHARSAGSVANGRADEGLSEIPTDPSAPSHPKEESASSSMSRRLKQPNPNTSGVNHRNATSLDRGPGGPRKKEMSAAIAKTEMEAANTPEPSAPAPPADASKDEHVGKIFGGKYRIDKLVAKGGMGRVYRGTQFPLERTVAIKILNREFQRTDPQFVRRFFLEAATAAKLSHPHTITVFDYGEADTGELYIAMEYLRGKPLSRVITNDGPFRADRALRVGIQVCRAVREAHQLGIIHRDLKPGNIFLVDEGEGGDDGDYAKVLDFGLVKLFRPENENGKHEAGMLGEGDPELTRTGTLLGSPKYMSPEQIQGHHLDPRTDIYSFGVILFQMLAGKPPYTGATGVDVIYKHVHAPIPTIQSINAEVECPEPVWAIVEKCLSKKRDERYASMDELVSVLKDTLRMVNGIAVSADSVAEIDRSRADSLRAKAKIDRPAPEVRPEASFKEQDVDAPTPIGHLAASERAVDISGSVGPQVRSSRAPLVLLGIGLVAAIGVLAWVATTGQRAQTPVPETVAAAKPPPVPELRFTSTPPGASVYDGQTSLGTTPFSKKMELGAPRELVFRYPGYKDQVKQVVLDGTVTAVDVKLEAEPEELGDQAIEDETSPSKSTAPSKKRKPVTTKPAKKQDGPYRQNPY